MIHVFFFKHRCKDKSDIGVFCLLGCGGVDVDTVAGTLPDRLSVGDKVFARIEAGGTLTGRSSFFGIGPNECNAFDRLAVQRQDIFIFEQHQPLAGDLSGYFCVGGPFVTHFRVLLRSIKQPHLKARAKDIGDALFDVRFGNLSAVEQGANFFGFQNIRLGHFDVRTGNHQKVGINNSPPVRHNQAVKAPFVTQNVGDEPFVLRGPCAVDLVIRSHYRFGVCFLNGSLKRREINFTQGAFIHNAVAVAPVVIGVVGGEVFDRCDYAIVLNPLDIFDHGSRGQVGIFAGILKISPAVWDAVDIHTRAQQNSIAVGDAFLGNRFPVVIGQIGIEGGGLTHIGRKKRCSLCHFTAHRRIGHFKYRQTDTFDAACLADLLSTDKTGSAEVGDLFVKGHLADDSVNSFLNGRIGFSRGTSRT